MQQSTWVSWSEDEQGGTKHQDKLLPFQASHILQPFSLALASAAHWDSLFNLSHLISVLCTTALVCSNGILCVFPWIFYVSFSVSIKDFSAYGACHKEGTRWTEPSVCHWSPKKTRNGMRTHTTIHQSLCSEKENAKLCKVLSVYFQIPRWYRKVREISTH